MRPSSTDNPKHSLVRNIETTAAFYYHGTDIEASIIQIKVSRQTYVHCMKIRSIRLIWCGKVLLDFYVFKSDCMPWAQA